MNFKEAKDKLKKLAKGEYHSIKYEITEYNGGELRQECSVYIAGRGWCEERTWELAFKSLRNEINPPSKKPVKIDNIEEIKKEA